MITRIHDLLEIDAQQFLEANRSAATWVAESLRATPFVVVRRGPVPEGEIAVGVRGEQRNQRWADSCHPSWIRRIVTPAELISRTSLGFSKSAQPPALLETKAQAPAVLQPRSDIVLALRSLAFLANHDSWKALSHRWGPGGSVGFELATGRHTARLQSDLDLVIYADERLSVEEAKHLHATTRNLPSRVDVRIETPFCGFSLAEYASCAPAPILLRKSSGVVLGADPWDDGECFDVRRCDLAPDATCVAREDAPRHDPRIDSPGHPAISGPASQHDLSSNARRSDSRSDCSPSSRRP